MSPDNKKIELKVYCHQSGRYTAQIKKYNESNWTDLKGKLLGNFDKKEFYLALNEIIESYKNEGYIVDIADLENS